MLRIPASSNADRGVACDAGGMALRAVIVDDSRVFLDAVRVLLERQGVSVVGVASTVAKALERVEQLRPEVVLVDIALGGESGFEVARRLAGLNANAPAVVLISTHGEAEFAELIAESPAAGFLPKADVSAQAIRRIVAARPG
jgi:DNA-binding NarL/FixJ family response regulator